MNGVNIPMNCPLHPKEHAAWWERNGRKTRDDETDEMPCFAPTKGQVILDEIIVLTEKLADIVNRSERGEAAKAVVTYQGKVIGTTDSDIQGSTVRQNLLMSVERYSPYCGGSGCSKMPRTEFNGSQFVCPECGWISQIPQDIIDKYKKRWSLK